MFGSRFSFWEKKAKDDGHPKLPATKKKEASTTSAKKRMPASNLLNNSNKIEVEFNEMEPSFLKTEENRASKETLESNKTVSAVLPNELHASAMFDEKVTQTSSEIKPPLVGMNQGENLVPLSSSTVNQEDIELKFEISAAVLNELTDFHSVQDISVNLNCLQLPKPECEEPEDKQDLLINSSIFVDDKIIEEKLSNAIEIPSDPGIKWKQMEKIWFMLEGALCPGHVVEIDGGTTTVPQYVDGKKYIQLDGSLKILLIPEEDVDLANDAQYDRVGDVSSLRHLNESSIIHTLTHRCSGGLFHTFVGPHLLTTCWNQLPNNPSLFSEKMKFTYKGCRYGDNPPHVYAIAQNALQKMMNTNNDQCIISLGHAGTCKSHNVKQILDYFVSVTSHSTLKEKKIESAVHLIESFTCAATTYCKSASRCICLYNLDFDRAGVMVSASIQAMLLERSRLIHRPRGEANFNIFYQLLHGADVPLRRELFLLDVEQTSNPLISNSLTSDSAFIQMTAKGFTNLQQGFEALKFKTDEIKAIFYVVAACVHLGMAGCQQVGLERLQFARADSAQKAASLLGISIERLAHIIFQQSKIQKSGSSSSIKRSTSSLSSNINSKNQCEERSKHCGQHMLDSFIISLYAEVFSVLVTLINRSLSTPHRAKNTILIIDAPGYSPVKKATFSDLLFNHMQDCLHGILHSNSFTLPRDRYEQECVDCELVIPDEDFSSSIEVVDKLPAVGSNGSKGLLWILDEEAISPGATSESFTERLLLYFDDKRLNDVPVLKKCETKCHFQLLHQAGELCIEYDASSWLEQAKNLISSTTTLEALQDSKKKFVSELFGGVIGEKMQGSVAGLKLDGGSSLRRATSFRNAWSTVPSSSSTVVKKSSCMLLKRQMECLLDMLKRSQPQFILCVCCGHHNASKNNEVDFYNVRKQLRGFQLLYIARAIKEGYPENMVLYDFRRHFDVLLRQISKDLPSNSTTIALMDDKEATESIIKHVELSRSQFRLGVSQVFFRSGVLNLLEDKRNEKVSNVLVLFQGACRGYLARRRLERRKVQDVAVRCLQRNIRKFMAIRQWPWWRLLTKVLPLVEVTRTEEELREIQAEYDLLKEKYDKIVVECDDYRHTNSKYEIKLQEALLHLEDEHTTAIHAGELLEHETKEKTKFEKQLKELQVNHNDLQKLFESMEVELAEKRLIYVEQHALPDSDEEIEEGEYKAKYERAVREFKFQLKKEKQNFDDVEEALQAEKKSLERKVSQLQEEMEDQRRIEQQMRKKVQRLNAQFSDAQIYIDETNAKNFELEKRQRKFDSELYASQADMTDLKVSKDRIQREKDKLAFEKNSLDREIMDKEEEIQQLKDKICKLEVELEDNNSHDTDDHQLVIGLKRQVRELEAKLKDQEEELEEQATSIHTLEQARERLEMSAEQSRQQRLRDMENKEDELEEMRSSYHKKIKHLEFQLEEEEQERTSLSKQRRDLEQELANLKDSGAGAHDVELERRLRRDLKRYKALLADSQTMIDHLKADVVSKQQMRQLKAQLEECEYTCSTAVKSRKAIELEVDDLQAQLDEVSRAKNDAESRISNLQRETHELRSKMEEDEEDAQENLRKYRALVAQHTDQQNIVIEAQTNLEELKQEKALLDEKVQTLQNQIRFMEESTIDKSAANRLENKVKDLETKLEFQKTTNRRLEVQLTRAKENNDKLMSERDSHIARENREREATKLTQRQLREAKNEQGDLIKREQEALKKKHDLEMELEESQNQTACLQADLKLAFKRISDLQIALEDLEESDVDEDDDEDDDSISSDENYTPKYGWRSRLSTSGMSETGRSFSVTSSSIRIDEEGKNSDGASPAIPSFNKTSKKQLKKKWKRNQHPEHVPKSSILQDCVENPISEIMSEHGRSILECVSAASSVKNVASLCSKKATSKTPASLEDPKVDRVSSMLAEENPSVLLYGKPYNIAKNLGLAKTETFQALNDSLRAVKCRQNLPKSQKAKLALNRKIQNEISEMQKRQQIERCSSTIDFISYESDDSDDFDIQLQSSFSDAGDLLAESGDSDESELVRCASEKWNLPKISQPERKTKRCSSQLQDVYKEAAVKPFKSRFLDNVKLRAKLKNSPKGNGSYQPLSRLPSKKSREKKQSPTRKLSSFSMSECNDMEYADSVCLDDYDCGSLPGSICDSDDVSLSRFGIAASPNSSYIAQAPSAGAEIFGRSTQRTGRSRRSNKKQENDNLRLSHSLSRLEGSSSRCSISKCTKSQATGRIRRKKELALSPDDQNVAKAVCNENFSNIDSDGIESLSDFSDCENEEDPETKVSLDSIISKYLYRK